MRILGHGLCSPLGPADVAAAALRGGLSRAGQIAWAEPLGYGEDAAPPVGHLALADCDPQAATRIPRLVATAAIGWSATTPDAILLALPLPDRLRWGPEPDAWERHLALVEGCAHSSFGAVPSERFAHGHAATAAALAQAEAQFAAGAWRSVLILAVDCLVDPTSLAWLAADDRLRSSESAHGLSPGEAAAWMLLGAGDGIRAGFVPGSAGRAPLDDAERWWSAAQTAGIQPGRPRRDQVDLTGEPWRDRAWGTLSLLLDDGPRPELPTRGWGDLGAAAALAATCAALARRDAGPVEQVIWSLAEDGSAGVVSLRT